MLLTATQITKSFARGARTMPVLTGVDLTVDAGQFIVIRGHSGCGKSTLLNILLGLLTPTSGKVQLDGQPLFSLSDAAASVLRNHRIGYASQQSTLLGSLTVLDNVRLPWFLAQRTESEPAGRALELLEKLGIADLAACYPATLSGGELRRAALARALMNAPALLVADEPTASLDAESARTVVALMKDLAQSGTGVLMVSHGEEGLALADQIFTLSQGRLTPTPTPKE